MVGVAVMLTALGGAAVFGAGSTAAGTSNLELYWINEWFPNCDERCPFYWPELGCWCVHLPPIVVEIPKN